MLYKFIALPAPAGIQVLFIGHSTGDGPTINECSLGQGLRLVVAAAATADIGRVLICHRRAPAIRISQRTFKRIYSCHSARCVSAKLQ